MVIRVDEELKCAYTAATVGATATGISESAAGAAAVGSAGVPFGTLAVEPFVSVAVQSLLIWPGCPHL